MSLVTAISLKVSAKLDHFGKIFANLSNSVNFLGRELISSPRRVIYIDQTHHLRKILQSARTTFFWVFGAAGSGCSAGFHSGRKQTSCTTIKQAWG
jgi:hypothetical protein